MTWAAMIDDIAKKTRVIGVRIGMLNRLRSLLSDRNMEAMYSSFIRSIMETPSMVRSNSCVGVADTHFR